MAKVIKSLIQSLYPYGIFRSDRGLSSSRPSPLAYLTFDDGPIPEVTPKVLAILERYGVKATFFMVGENIDKYPEVFAQVVKAGHSIGNHTYNHMKGWRVSTAEYIDNVRKFPKQTKLFRPPYGRTWLWQRKAVKDLGYEIYLWDVLTRDYNAKRTPEAMLRQIQRQTRPGSIINFHDSLKSNGRMLEVLPKAIEWLEARGYRLEGLEARG